MADNIPRFGASDFFLAETDPVALREQLRASLAALLGRDVVESDPHMVLASAFLPYLVQGQASADACAKATLRAFAVGQDLDRIADATCVVGYLDRKPARGAILACIISGTVERSAADAASEYELRWSISAELERDGQAATFSGSGSILQKFLLTDGLSKVFVVPVYLTCETPGPDFNRVFPDALSVVHSDDLTDALNIEAVEAPGSGTGQTYEVQNPDVGTCGESYGGADAESDEEFAARVEWQARALRVPGSLEYYKLILSEVPYLASWYVAPTVDDDGRIVVAWCDKAHFIAGLGGIVLTADGDAYAAFKAAVKSALLVGQTAYAYPAVLADSVDPRVVTAHYKLPASTIDEGTARKAVRDAWSRYLASHAWHCGVLLDPSEMVSVLQSAGAVDAYIVSPISLSNPMPADAIVVSRQFQTAYDGIATASVDPVGGSGEVIS